MTFLQLARLFIANFKIIALVPLVLAITVYLGTMGEVQTFTSKTLVYTGLASGYTIVETSGGKIDRNTVNNAFDNFIEIVKSREVLEEVGLRLLALHLSLAAPDPSIITEDSYNLLMEAFPADLKEELVVIDSSELTYSNLKARYDSNDLVIRSIVSTGTGPYSVNTISTMNPKRLKSSDMIEIEYNSTDPGICQQTLLIHIDVFSRKFVGIKETQTSSVVQYFQEQLKLTTNRLHKAEGSLTEFRANNQIINYEAQTKTLAEMKENITYEYKQEVMNMRGAEAALKELERKLGIKENIFVESDEILRKRERLTALMTEIALKEAYNESDGEILRLKNEVADLQKDLKFSVGRLYNYTHSTEGIPIATLLDEWINNLLTAFKSHARTIILDERLGEIDEQYDFFAPLGSELADLEREIEIAEKEYMEILHSLNQSKLRQHNNEMASNLEIVDKPFYPLEPAASKRMMLVAVSIIAGFVMTFAFYIIIEFLDNTVASVERALKLTGLKLAGALPIVDESYSVRQTNLLGDLLDQAIGNILMARRERKNKDYTMVNVSSVQRGEGTSFVSSQLVNELRKSYGRVLYVMPIDSASDDPHVDDVTYITNNKIIDAESFMELTGERVDMKPYTFIIMEVPPIQRGQMPLSMLKNADITMMVLRANRSWGDADNYALNHFIESTGIKPLMFLNGAKLNALESVIGHVEKKRTWVRAFIKKLLMFEFKGSKHITS